MTNRRKILLPALLGCAMTMPTAVRAEGVSDVLLVKKVTRTSSDGRTHNFIQLTYEGLQGITIIAVKINRGDCIVDSSTGLEFPYKMGFDEKIKIRAMRGPTECNPVNILIDTNIGSELFPLMKPASP